jgi:hypothetical protein
MVSGRVCSTASGSAAIATLLTDAAETAAVMAPAPPSRFRRESISMSFVLNDRPTQVDAQGAQAP